MTKSKAETKVQGNLIEFWKPQGFRSKKTHEILSSGKPDLRVGNPKYGQLDTELKVKTTGITGPKTGITPLQEDTINEMNLHGMPAVGLIWDVPSSTFWLSILGKDDIREIAPYRRIQPVVHRTKVLCDPLVLFLMSKRFLDEHGYPSAAFLHC